MLIFYLQECFTDYETIIDDTYTEECETVLNSQCTDLHQQIVDHNFQLAGGELLHQLFPDRDKAVVLDIFSAVPNCHDNKVKCKT